MDSSHFSVMGWYLPATISFDTLWNQPTAEMAGVPILERRFAKFHQSYHDPQRIELPIDEAYSDDLVDPMTILIMTDYLAELTALKLAIIVRRLIMSLNPMALKQWTSTKCNISSRIMGLRSYLPKLK